MKKLLFLLALCAVVLRAEEVWPDRKALMDRIVPYVPWCIKTFDPATGEFGTKPWICTDQNALWPLAVAWATEMPGNPYYHDPKILAMIAKGGEKLVDEQDPKGMWIFRKKDNSTWGMIHMPWTYIRWIRAWMLVRDALPETSRAKWEKGLKLGFGRIAPTLPKSRVQNIPATRAAALYIAGIAFEREDWKKIATAYLHRVIDAQAPDGWWTEHYGPVVGYNFVYLDALGAYYHYSKDPKALDSLRRGAKFHAALLWQDGTSVSAIDERNPYSRSLRVGNIGFSHSPEGRWYLLKMTKLRPLTADTAAGMLMEGGTGTGKPPFAEGGSYLAQDGKFIVSRHQPYQWCFSAYTCKPAPARWIMERQCHVEIAHDKFGVIAGGGNTRMQPYFSCFTFGDPDAVQPDLTTDKPDFFPKADLVYLADTAKIDGNTLRLNYGGEHASVTLTPDGDALNVDYHVKGSFAKPVMAHLPLLRGADLRRADGKLLPPTDKPVSGRELGGKLVFAPGLAVVFPEDAVIHPAVVGFNPYQKLGKGAHPRMVVSVPLTKARPTARIRFEPLAEAAETTLWNGDMRFVRTRAERCPAAKVELRDGMLEYSGRTTADSNGYIFTTIAIPPTVVDGKTLTFDIDCPEVLPKDVLYVKGRAGKKCVFSAMTRLKPGHDRRTLTVRLPGCPGFKLMKDQIEIGPDAPVTTLEFHYGRSVRSSEMKFRLGNLKMKTEKK